MVKVYEFAPFGRPVTKVRYNIPGDLCFASSKNKLIAVWRTDPLETFGFYQGHTGAIDYIDISYDSRFLISAGSDYFSYIFNVETGQKLWSGEEKGKITTCGISTNCKSFFITYSTAEKAKYLKLYNDLNSPKDSKTIILANNDAHTTCATWSPLDDSIILCLSDGTIHFYDIKAQCVKLNTRAHDKSITDFSISSDGLFAISASADKTAKMWNLIDMSLVQTYKTPRLVNTAGISPVKPHLALAGGVPTSEVTMTSLASQMTQHRLFNYLTGVEFANIPGHLGPVNSLRFHPDGHSFVSGAESGTVRFHCLDEKIFN